MSYAEEQLAHLQEQKERAMGIDVTPQMAKEMSKIDELVMSFKQEVERQANAVDSITQKTASVVVDIPRNDMSEAKIAEMSSSQLVNQLRDILDGFAANTNRLFSIADRIEL